MKNGDDVVANGSRGVLVDDERTIVRLENGAMYYRPRNLTPFVEMVALPVYTESFPCSTVPSPPKKESSVLQRLAEEAPMEITAAFDAHLQNSDLNIRVGWVLRIDEEVRGLFQEFGIVLPDGARPFNIGSRGGDVKKAKRGLGIEVTFNTPADLSILPDLRRRDKDGRSQICNTRFGFSLLRHGFSVTEVTQS